ncbi:MAG: hypothetical protein ABF290_11745 [Thiogranum sp.]
MKKRFLLICFSVLLLSACSTTEVVNTWKDDSQDQKFSNILVVAVSKVPAYRSLLEHELVGTIRKTGADAKATVDILPNTDLIDEAAADATVKETGADGVMVVRLVDTKKEEVYTPGTTYVQGGYGGRYNRGWYGYYGSGYQVMSTPGYSTEYNVSTVETTLFDTATNKRVWSTITATTETTTAAAINSYLRAIGKPIKESGLFQ